MEKTDTALAKILNALADKFGTTVDHLYAVMIRQAYIDGIEACMAIIPVSLLMGGFYRYVEQQLKTVKHDPGYTTDGQPIYSGYNDYFSENPGAFVVGLIIAMVFLGVLIGAGCVAVDCFANPEYYALKQLIK